MSLPDSNRPSLSSYNAPEEWIRFYDKPSILKPFDSIQVRPHEAPVRPREAPVRPRETPVERWDRINVDPPNIKVNPFDCIADRTYVAPGERWPRLSGDPPIRPRSSISNVYDEEFRFKGLMYQGQNVAELDLTGNRGCINYFKKKWKTPTGKIVIVASIVLITVGVYAAVSGIVQAASSTEQTDHSRVMPFSDTASGIYNKDIDDRLKFVTAIVSLQLRNICNVEENISWDTLQNILAQCTVLEADQNITYGEETYSGKFSETDVSTWFYDFVKNHDSDVLDASRIHSTEINEVIQFVANQTVDFHVFSKSVSSSSSLLDIGMIRFPTKKDPFVKLYRLQLKGAFSGKRFMMVFTSGEERILTATVTSCKYYPRNDLLQHIQTDKIKTIVRTFEDMFA